jgi:glucose-6-phosphate dehydrogenase assembly protein OpcA
MAERAERTLIWQAEDTSLGKVVDALREAALQPAGAEAGAPVPRARALTLVMVADGEDERRAEAIARLALRHPLRAILVARLRDAAGPALSARVRRHARPGAAGAAIAEEIDLHVRGELADHLGQLLAPLLLPELPVTFWCVGGSVLRGPAFAELRELCDRGVVDLRDSDALGEDLAAIGAPETIDVLTWRRQAPWREQVASLFDPPDHRAAAGRIQGVEIAHAERGHLAAHLLGGWIASRLDLPASAVCLRGSGEPAPRSDPGRGRAYAVNEVALTTAGGVAYRVRATADGEHATLHRPGSKPQRSRLGALSVGEALDSVLAGPADTLWPPAWRAACAIAGVPVAPARARVK